MHLLLRGVTALLVIGFVATTVPAIATAQRTTDTIEYIPDPNSATPQSYGVADITYYPTTPTRSLMRWQFWQLDPGSNYVIVVQGQDADGTPFTGRCDFTANPGGDAECTARFTGLSTIANSVVTQDGPDGPIAMRMR